MIIYYDIKTTLELPLVEALNYNKARSYRKINTKLENTLVEKINTKKGISFREIRTDLAPIVLEKLAIKVKAAPRQYFTKLEDIKVEELSNGLRKNNFRKLNNKIDPIIVETLAKSKKKPIFREMVSVVSPEDSGPDVLLFPEFITLPASINREEDNIFLVDKAKLLEQDPVAQDGFFSDPNNWKKIILLYRSTTGVHRTISFDLSKDNPDGVLNPSLTDPNNWELIGATVYGNDPQDNISLDRLYLINYPYDFSIA